ncbi:MAG TPA: PhoU domain-containing protein [Acidimicrobiales bacterium]|nr:PhoU domain-containing protein [Acidimicrobiales bacterium]
MARSFGTGMRRGRSRAVPIPDVRPTESVEPDPVPTWLGADPAGRGAAEGIGTSGAAVLAEIDRLFVQAFALVGEAIAGATHALLAADREAAKQLMHRDELVDQLSHQIAGLAQERLLSGEGSLQERRELLAVLRMLPDLERNGDLAEHIARRAARGLGVEMSARSRGLVERMGEVATTIWRSTADVFASRSVAQAVLVDDLDDEMDDLHVTLTAEVATGTMPLPVAIELAMVARFFERFGDHAVSLARRMAALISGGPEPGTSGPD